MSFTRSKLAKRLRELRRLNDLTQEAFSENSQISYKYYQQIEAGRRIDVRLSTLEKIAAAYKIGVHELLSPELPKTANKARKTERQQS